MSLGVAGSARRPRVLESSLSRPEKQCVCVRRLRNNKQASAYRPGDPQVGGPLCEETLRVECARRLMKSRKSILSSVATKEKKKH